MTEQADSEQAGSGLDSLALERCRRIICFVAASSGFQWQSYVPTLALLVQELGYPITHVGWLYLAFVGTSILASLSLHAHLKVFSPYNLLCIGYSLRCLSGALHTLGSLLVSQATWPLLICSRIVHGYSILLFPLSVVWIGARESVEQRGATLAQRNAYSTVGIFLGIVSGATLSAVMPTVLLAGAAPGVLSIVVSLLMLLWLQHSFTDRDMLPTSPPKKADGVADEAPWLHIILVGFAQFMGWVGFVAIEGSLSLIIVEAYGFTHSDVIVVWAPTSSAMLLGTVLFSMLHKSKWDAGNIASIGLVALPVSAISTYHAVGGVHGGAYDQSSLAVASFVMGLGSLLFAFALTNTLFNAMLMQHLLPHQQAEFQTPVQTLAAVGRGVGPYIGTMLIATGDDIEPGLGPRLMLLMSISVVALSIVIPSAFGRSFFDPPRPKPTMW